MKVVVSGCNDPILEQELITAAKFFGRSLLSKQMYKYIHLDIELVSKINDLGNCCITYYNDWYKAREFEIQLRKKRSLKNTLITLAHEMVHVKQFAKGELNDDQNKWKGEFVDSDNISYFELPWEIEATSLEHILYTMYLSYRDTLIREK